MGYLDPIVSPPRLGELAPTVRARINTAEVRALITSPLDGDTGDRVLAAKGVLDLEDPNVGPPWGRVVVMVGRSLWDSQEQPGRERLVRVLVRAEVRPPGKGYNPDLMLEAVHAEVFARLVGWKPSAAEIQATRPAAHAAAAVHFEVRFPFYRRSVDETPLWDEERGIWYQTAEFRSVVGPVT